MLIYKIINTINNKIYVGQTTRSLEERWYQHIYDCQRTKRYFHKAIKKYGPEAFIREVIEECDDINILNEREQYWIEFYDTMNKTKGYNSTNGGSNFIFSDATKEKLKQNHRRFQTNETKEKIRQARLGKTHSEETKKKISQSELGKKVSDESKFKMSQSALKRWETQC